MSKRIQWTALVAIAAITFVILERIEHDYRPAFASVTERVANRTSKPESISRESRLTDVDANRGSAIIPGGIHSLSESFAAYPDLDRRLAHFSVLPGNVWAFVSYRRNGKVFWTKKRRLIRAGEAILTDGQIIILVRCGNELSVDGPLGTTEDIPPADVYPPDESPSSTDPITEYPPPSVPEPAPNLGFLSDPPPPAPPVEVWNGPPCASCGVVFFVPPPPPPVAVPEPSSISLLLIGLGSIAAFIERQK